MINRAWCHLRTIWIVPIETPDQVEQRIDFASVLLGIKGALAVYHVTCIGRTNFLFLVWPILAGEQWLVI